MIPNLNISWLHITAWPHKAVFEHILLPISSKSIYHLKIVHIHNFVQYMIILITMFNAIRITIIILIVPSSLYYILFEHILLPGIILKIMYHLKVFSIYYFQDHYYPYRLVLIILLYNLKTYCQAVSSKTSTTLKYFQFIIFISNMLIHIVFSSLY